MTKGSRLNSTGFFVTQRYRQSIEKFLRPQGSTGETDIFMQNIRKMT